MAEKLMKYYDFIKKEKGLNGGIQLATATKIPSIMAASAPDSPENIQVFKEAIQKITGSPAPNF